LNLNILLFHIGIADGDSLPAGMPLKIYHENYNWMWQYSRCLPLFLAGLFAQQSTLK
jgi:hypothetical protein